MIEAIENIVCAGEVVNPSDIHVEDRETKIKETRQIIMYLCKEQTTLTQKAIGEYFGMDHATVYNAWRRTQNICDTDSLFRAKIENYRLQIIPLIENYYLRQKATMEISALLSMIELMEARLTDLNNNFNNLRNNILTINK